jgi:2-iminobutanoate/2-iminopropanoate deaminase
VSIELIQAPGTKPPRGHYSQAIVANGMVFLAGLVPVDLETGEPKVGTIEEQTERVLRNAERILQAAGSSLGHLVQVTVFLTRIDDWDRVNRTYGQILGEHRPSRTVVPVAPLHLGAGIEIQCVAVVAGAG